MKRRWVNIENYKLNLAANRVDRSDYLHIEHELEQTGNRFEALLKQGEHRVVLGGSGARQVPSHQQFALWRCLQREH